MKIQFTNEQREHLKSLIEVLDGAKFAFPNQFIQEEIQMLNDFYDTEEMTSEHVNQLEWFGYNSPHELIDSWDETFREFEIF